MVSKRVDLVNGLKQYGYPLLQTEQKVDPLEFLVALAQSKETRFLEGFPVVLARCLEDKDSGLDMTKVAQLLGSNENKLFNEIFFISLELFKLYNLDFKYPNETLSKWNFWKSDNKEGRKKLFDGEVLIVDRISLDMRRLKKRFLDYVVLEKEFEDKTSKEKIEMEDEFKREYSLSYFLSPKQKELVHKRIAGKTMTKTEKEYYSRVVKKKLVALANPDLSRWAMKALQ